jgi:hypothetical protein
VATRASPSPSPFSGILYPSIRMGANGDNVALFPTFVDQHLEFRRATRFKIDEADGKLVKITALDYAKAFNPDGSLQWLGDAPHWQIKKQWGALQFKGTAGRDSDGDYELGKDGPVYWVATDPATGKVVELSEHP